MDLISLAGQWGIAGLFFIMWYLERKDRDKAEDTGSRLEALVEESRLVNISLIEVVQENSKCLSSFKEVLRRLLHELDSREKLGETTRHG